MFAIIEKLVIKTKLRIIETTICELPGSEDLMYMGNEHIPASGFGGETSNYAQMLTEIIYLKNKSLL